MRKAAGHVLTRGEQTFANFYKELLQARSEINVSSDQGADAVAVESTDQAGTRLRRRTTTTNCPPAPVLARLGDLGVRSDDIRRPLGLKHRPPEAALLEVANG